MYLIEPYTISVSVRVLYVDPAHIITGYIYHNILLEGSKGVRVNSFVFTFAESLYNWQPVKVFKTLNDPQSGIFNKFDLSKNLNQFKLSYVD